MVNKKALLPILACALLVFACDYIVIPEEEESGSIYGISEGWSAAAVSIGKSEAGDLRIELAIQNNTADWSAMRAEENPAVMTFADGKKTNCETVFVGTGGHRLAPGFRMRGYIGGKKMEQKVQLLFVECKEAEAGVQLSIPITYVTGKYNYYEQDKNKVNSTLEVDLESVAVDITYPVAALLDGLIQTATVEMTALNDVVFALTNIERTDAGFSFTWQTTNPGEYPTFVHIGNPPVIGNDGILYGFYETPDIVSAPITPSGGSVSWTTEVAVPGDIHGFYIMLSVEAGKQRLFDNYTIDITGW